MFSCARIKKELCRASLHHLQWAERKQRIHTTVLLTPKATLFFAADPAARQDCERGDAAQSAAAEGPVRQGVDHRQPRGKAFFSKWALKPQDGLRMAHSVGVLSLRRSGSRVRPIRISSTTDRRERTCRIYGHCRAETVLVRSRSRDGHLKQQGNAALLLAETLVDVRLPFLADLVSGKLSTCHTAPTRCEQFSSRATFAVVRRNVVVVFSCPRLPCCQHRQRALSRLHLFPCLLRRDLSCGPFEMDVNLDPYSLVCEGGMESATMAVRRTSFLTTFCRADMSATVHHRLDSFTIRTAHCARFRKHLCRRNEKGPFSL